MKKLITLLLASLGSPLLAAEAAPMLPPDEIIAQVLRGSPMVNAAASQINVEEANRRRLEAGHYEWNIRLGGQQRKATPSGGPDERFNEWNAALERPVRLPGKASLDTELGAAGVALAETAHGDALHESSRSLLKSWFTWLKENAAAAQWAEQVALLEKQSKAVKRRQQLGDAAQLEAIQSEAALAQAEAQRTQAQIRQRTAAEELRRRFPGLPLNEPANIAAPAPITGDQAEWLEAILKQSHELGMARGESQLAQVSASRAGRDRLPDPTIGLHVSRERGGEENVIGAYITIPLPGGGRRATSDASLARVSSANYREAAARQKIEAEAVNLYQTASAALPTWQASRHAAERLNRAADMTERAYLLGEGSLNDLLLARRQANEAQLTAQLLQLEALELGYRLRLDAHQLWDLD
ncbi:MAG: transporter [Betaproteobacteria bacterium HGW-Betaproteobacteria-10]|nr:MAG: transporter [Betaproteobacteria bacterium HGW-Betaproteobacteria-10]